MNQYTFASRHKTVLFGFMILGLLCMAITFFAADDELHSRFWSNYLHNTVFFTGIGFISLFVISAFITAWSGWHVVVKRIWEAYSLFLIPGLILLLVLIAGLWGGFHHLYHWADAKSVEEDAILAFKSSFLNRGWYTFGTLIIVGGWIIFARRLRQLSVEEGQGIGNENFAHHRKMRIWAAAFLPIGGFTSVAMIWQWVMSLDAHWYSTLFAWYATASWFCAAMALTIMMIIWLKSMGYMEYVTSNHLHDIGKYMFAFSIFWTYLWFSQYMLIWYANVGEETVYFQNRIDNFPILFYSNLVINFFFPFLILMRNDTKRKYGTLIFASILVFFGHWWDYFQMIKPGVYHTAHELMAQSHGAGEHGAEAGHHAMGFVAGFSMPGMLELGTMLGFLAFFLYFVLSRLEKAPLLAEKDPYLKESLGHHVWPF